MSSTEPPVQIFISYSRTDSDFANRLEADLKKRAFRTWVDRSKLEGGQVWMDEIQKALEWCTILILVVSPEAMASKYVRMEYRFALGQEKLVIPVYCRPTLGVPFEISSIQWVNFQRDYSQGLHDLLTALSPKFIPNETLYPPVSIKVAATIAEKEPEYVAPEPAPPSSVFESNIENRVRKIIIDQLDVDEREVIPTALFVEDLNADSMDLLELLFRFEEEFKIQIPYEDAEKLLVVQDVTDYISEHLV